MNLGSLTVSASRTRKVRAKMNQRTVVLRLCFVSESLGDLARMQRPKPYIASRSLASVFFINAPYNSNIHQSLRNTALERRLVLLKDYSMYRFMIINSSK